MIRSLTGYLVAALVTVVPAVAAVPVPRLVAEIDLPAPVRTLRVTRDGTRALAVLQQQPTDVAIQVALLEIEGRHVTVKGSFSAESQSGTEIAIAPNGRTGALLVYVDPIVGTERVRRAIVRLDLTGTTGPAALSRSEVVGRDVGLSADTSAFAFSNPDDSRGQQIVVRYLDGRPDIVVDVNGFHSVYPIYVSSRARHIAYMTTLDSITIIALNSGQPVVYEQENPTFGGRYHCLAAILDSGYALIEDARAPRLGIYASLTKIPRIAKLPHETGSNCQRLDHVDDTGVFTFVDDQGVLRRLDLGTPERPRWSGEWMLPSEARPLAVAGSLVFAASGRDARRLAIYRLDETESVTVDWPALETVHRIQLAKYADGANEIVTLMEAVRELERAGVVLAFESPPAGLSPQRAAAILNDYGFLAGKYGGRAEWAETALRRAIALDPKRALAPANLADLLRQRLPIITSPADKQALAAEIEALNRASLALGGKRSLEMEVLLDGRSARESRLGACEAIADLANTGQLQNSLSESALDFPVGKRRLDLRFGTQGTAHGAVIYAFDPETDFPADDPALHAFDEEDISGGAELRLFVHHDVAHIVHIRDESHPVASASVNGDARCTFSFDVAEKAGPRVTEPALCRQLLDGGRPEPIELTRRSTLPHAVVAKTYRETEAGLSGPLDFMNDGRPLNVVELGLASGAGAGCSLSFYDLLNENGNGFSSGPQRDLLLKLQRADPADRYPVRPCGNDPRFVRYGGKVYFETKPKVWPPSEKADEYHRVTRIEGMEVHEVCDFRFDTRVVPTNNAPGHAR
jgi:hypothetical protein